LPICYRLVAGIHHGAVALDIADDLPVIDAVNFGDGQVDFQAPPMARIIYVADVQREETAAPHTARPTRMRNRINETLKRGALFAADAATLAGGR
jgi:hypothetical protein